MELENTLIIVAVLLISLFLYLLFRKLIILISIELLKGRYSYEYLSAFKKFFMRSPFQYGFDDEFIQKVLSLVEEKGKSPVFKTSVKINFGEYEFGSKMKKLLKQNGDPDYFSAFRVEDPAFEVKVCVYNSFVEGIKATTRYYYINDEFLMGEYVFKNVRSPIKQHISAKYLNNGEIVPDKFLILNSRKNFIQYNNTAFTIDIQYIDIGNSHLLEKISGYQQKRSSMLSINENMEYLNFPQYSI